MKRKSVKRITEKIMKNNSIQESKDQKLEVSFSNEERIEIEIIKSIEKNNVDSYDGINGKKFYIFLNQSTDILDLTHGNKPEFY